MVKILHCADLHIDTVFSGYSPAEASKRRDELVRAFAKTVEIARNERVELFLIAGDFLDCDFVNYDTVRLLAAQMESLPECRFIIAPGNHDPYTKKGAYSSTVWPENVYIFASKEIGMFSFDEINTDVYGYAFEDKAMGECALDGYKPENSDRINVIVAHCEINDMSSRYCPTPRNLLESLDADYIALGHIHAGATEYNGEKYAYSGSLTGRAFDETGAKGYIIGEIGKNERRLGFRQLSDRKFEIRTIDVTSVYTQSEMETELLKIASEYDKNTSLRIVLNGELHEDIDTGSASEKAKSAVYELQTVNAATAPVSYTELEHDPTIKGAIYAKLKKYLESADAKEREKGRRALVYALSALSGKITQDRGDGSCI